MGKVQRILASIFGAPKRQPNQRASEVLPRQRELGPRRRREVQKTIDKVRIDGERKKR